jgi:hypothetical protein
MLIINDDIIAGVYSEYNNSQHDRERTEVLYSGVKRILFRLKRYVKDPVSFKKRSKIAIDELITFLNRFYYHDTQFIDKLIYEARAYIIEISEE